MPTALLCRAEAIVWARWPDEGTGRRRIPCRPDGAFRVDGLVGIVACSTYAPGFRGTGDSLGCVHSGGTVRMDLEMVRRSTSLRLSVLGPEDRPLAGLRVSGGTQRDLETGCDASSTSDPEGRVTLDGLVPGDQVRLRFSEEGALWCRDPTEDEDMKVTADAAAPVRAVHVVRGSSVRGVVRAATGETLGRGYVVSIVRGNRMEQAVTDDDGRVTFDNAIPAGRASIDGCAFREAYDVDVTPGAFDLDVVVDPCVRIEAHVLHPGGAFLCTAWPNDPGRCGLWMQVEAEVEGRTVVHPLALVRADGVFAAWIPAASAREARVVFRLGGEHPMDVVVSGRIPRTRTGRTALVDLFVSRDVLATVRGRVLHWGSNTPVNSSLVHLKPLGPGASGRDRYAHFFGSDRIELPLVLSGTYELNVSEMGASAARTITVPTSGVLDLGEIELQRR